MNNNEKIIVPQKTIGKFSSEEFNTLRESLKESQSDKKREKIPSKLVKDISRILQFAPVILIGGAVLSGLVDVAIGNRQKSTNTAFDVAIVAMMVYAVFGPSIKKIMEKKKEKDLHPQVLIS